MVYLPLANEFIKPDGDHDLSLCSAYGIHLVKAGYGAWALALNATIKKIINKNQF